MKMIKYLSIFMIIIILGVLIWFYYPQYQIKQIKKDVVSVNADEKQTSYLDYFKEYQRETIQHLALGDSIVKGVGAEENQDFVRLFSDKLQQESHKNIISQNEGIPGITSEKLKLLIQEGTFDESIKSADIITINVGGNDILRLAKNQNYYAAIQSFEELQNTFTNNLTEALNYINTLNPNATIVLLELYNPLNAESEFYSFADKLLPQWNLNIYKLSSEMNNSIVIETTKVINKDNLNYISSDGVHPNYLGYDAISQQIMEQFKLTIKKEKI